MVKVYYNQTTGAILGYYPNSEVYPSGVPEPTIEIDKATHMDCINNPGRRKVDPVKKIIIVCDPPKSTLAETQTAALQRLDSAAVAAYTAGFESSASGAPLWYDSDVDSQRVIDRQFQIALNARAYYEATVFMPGVPAGLTPITARPAQNSPESAKTTQQLNADQMIQLGTDQANAWALVKAHHWQKKALVFAAKTVEEAEVINW